MGLLTRSARAAAVLAIAACSPGATVDPGTDATMRIPGAQFERGAMPAGSAAGPTVASIVLVNALVHPNEVNYPIGGALGASATAAAIGMQGDVGYWIVPAGLPSAATPTDPSYAAAATFAPEIGQGQYTLVVRAVDARGSFGLPSSRVFTVQASPSAPAGAFVVSLTWDTESDMDLHVVDAMDVEIDHVTMSDQPPPFDSQPEGGSFGYLDWDSNANCVIDGKREEDVVWPNTPPAGTYTVRVDAASLCGQPIAHWTVTALLDGQSLGEARGVAVDADTRGPHGSGAGVTALQLDVP